MIAFATARVSYCHNTPDSPTWHGSYTWTSVDRVSILTVFKMHNPVWRMLNKALLPVDIDGHSYKQWFVLFATGVYTLMSYQITPTKP